MRKRMHPLQIIHSIFEIIRSNIFLIIILFILNWGSKSLFIKFGRWAFFLFLIGTIIYLIVAWFINTYEFKDHTVHMYTGVFRKKHSSVPLNRIQNVQRTTPFYFKMFGVTSLGLETGIQEDGASMHFDAVTLEEADWIERYVDEYRQEVIVGSEEELPESEDNTVLEEQTAPAERQVHFNPTKKEILKASFLSFSFLAVIPLAITGYIKIEDVIDIEDQVTGIFSAITSSWLSITLTVLAILAVAIIFGIIYAYLRYGKYEVASDEKRIYIRSGVLNEKAFSIRKDRVQAIQIQQPFLKKLLGLAEVRLISASSGIGETSDISSLYPFLPVERAYSILVEILPEFKVHDDLEKLPKRALKVKMLRIPWFLLIATGLVIIINAKFWWILIGVALITYALRYFNYRNTRYTMAGSFIQFKVGGLSTTVYITTRQKITEVGVSQTFLQRKFNLTSIETSNRTALFHIEILDDIPIEVGEQFTDWYAKRLEEIEIE